LRFELEEEDDADDDNDEEEEEEEEEEAMLAMFPTLGSCLGTTGVVSRFDEEGCEIMYEYWRARSSFGSYGN
jgi:hypothetical protein